MIFTSLQGGMLVRLSARSKHQTGFMPAEMLKTMNTEADCNQCDVEWRDDGVSRPQYTEDALPQENTEN